MSEELEAREIAAEQEFVDGVYVQLEASAPDRAGAGRARATTAAGSATRAASSSATRWSSRPPSGSPSSTPPTRAWSSAASTCDAERRPAAALHRPDRPARRRPRLAADRLARARGRGVLPGHRRRARRTSYAAGCCAAPARTVVGVEDELLDDQAETDLPIVGEGALMAQLSRARDRSMHSIVATIQAEQDQAIRAPGKGVVSISGGPGTGKTVVALHRAAFLLYTDRRRYEGGGVLVVGPSGVFMRYIERVLPCLGETAVALRSLGEVVDGVRATRHDEPAVADVKGSARMAELLRRTAAPAGARQPRRASGSSGATTRSCSTAACSAGCAAS